MDSGAHESDLRGSARRRGRGARRAGARSRAPRRGRPAARLRPGAGPRRAGGRRPRRAQPDRGRRPGARPGGVVGELVARVSGFGPLQRYLDDPRSRRSGSTTRAGSSSPGNGRHELTNVDPHHGRGAGAGRADAQVQRSADRHQPAVRGRDAARGPPAARRARGDQPRLRRGQHPQVRASRRRGSTTSSSWAASPRRPRGSSRPRCSPGSTSWSPAARRRARPRC